MDPELARDAGGHGVIDCVPCGFAHLWPKPTPEALAEYYAESFYETHSPADWADKEEAEEPYWQIEHRDRVTAFSELLGRPTGSVLDIGCGGAWLLRYAAKAGWDVQGIEPSKSMWERAHRRAPVLLGTFPDVDLGGRTFDVVNLKLVMEHVPDPALLLREVRQVLNPGGVVCIEVPNDFNRLQAAVRAPLRQAGLVGGLSRAPELLFVRQPRTAADADRLRAGQARGDVPDGVVSAAGRRLHRSGRARPASVTSSG